VLKVDEIAKEEYQPCVHLKADCTGCSIYGTRYEICRVYKCAWLLGAWEESDRPDKRGVLTQEQVVNGEWTGAIEFVEVVHGKLASPAVRAMIDAVSGSGYKAILKARRFVSRD